MPINPLGDPLPNHNGLSIMGSTIRTWSVAEPVAPGASDGFTNPPTAFGRIFILKPPRVGTPLPEFP